LGSNAGLHEAKERRRPTGERIRLDNGANVAPRITGSEVDSDKIHEVFQKLKSQYLTFFRMKLRRKDTVLPDSR